jgi:tRNA(Ile2) C34 agmatinyltransferase TiaS
MMDNHCPYCGISVAGQFRCPLCDTRLASVGVRVSLRRALLWAFVVEEFVLLMVLRRLA